MPSDVAPFDLARIEQNGLSYSRALRRVSSTMFEKHSESGYHPALAGIERKTLAHGEKTLMTEFRLHKGAVLPRHAHPHEQTGYLIMGRIRLWIGAEQHEALAGDSWCILGGIEHGADILEDSIAVEVFSPVREDYVPGRA